MELEGNSSAATSVTFLQQLRAHHPEPLIVIWDNGPAHGGAPLRAYLTTPDLRLRLVRLPAYSPDFNPDEHVWGWVRAEVTANTCFGTTARVREKVGAFFRAWPIGLMKSNAAAKPSSRPKPIATPLLSTRSFSLPPM